MKEFVTVKDNGFVWNLNNELVWVKAWGKNGVRIRVTKESQFRELPQGLMESPLASDETTITIEDQKAVLSNGEIMVHMNLEKGQLDFIRSSDNKVVLQERELTTAEHHARSFTPGKGTWKIDQRFFAHDDEKLYGLGQRQHGYLDQKGCTMDLMHRNSEVSIPFMVSNRGYGFLWNNPGLGRVALGRNDTRWTMDQGYQIDYYVVIDESPAAILERYAEATGKPSKFPEWGAGFWQCKLRYISQEELLGVAREYYRRKLPVSVMIIDFYHWTVSGDWSFDPELWPDPSAMVKELKSMGMECMVSVWPTVDITSKNFLHMKQHGLLLKNEYGNPFQNADKRESFYDATHPQGREYHWEQIRKGYLEHGIKLFWLDTMEPEIVPLEPENTRGYLGNHAEVGGLYPLCHQQAYYEGLIADGEEAPMTLGRSAWVGSQRFGGAVWSADIPSTFESLRRQVRGGLNIAMSGIPWWTTDAGGFHGGRIGDTNFHELLIRWFQYSVFCPIMRTHGIRTYMTKDPNEVVKKADPHQPQAPNEVWSYGEDSCEILSAQVLLRESLKPYIMEIMKTAESSGVPPMRPVFVDFPKDNIAWEPEDQFMFGPDILVSPVLTLGARSRSVYLPTGTRWRNAWTGTEHEGGITLEVDAPLENIPLFLKAGSLLNFNK